MNNLQHTMKRASILLGILALSASAARGSITINLGAATLQDARGNPMPTTGLVILVATTNDTQFQGPTATAFVSGDDIEVARFDLSSSGCGGGCLTDSTGTLNLFGTWKANNPLAIYWYPTLTKSASAPGAGAPYGFYTDPVGIDGSDPWATPADGSSVDLFFLTSDQGGSNPMSAGVASHVVPGGGTTLSLTSSANPAPTGQAVTFTATVAPVMSSAVTPTGNATFKDGATALGTSGLNGAGVATFSTSSLSHGSHIITAEWAGDANYLGSTNTLSAAQVINTPPVANLATYTRSPDLSLKIPITNLMASFTTDADGDARSLTSVGSGTNGATVTVSGGRIYYLPSTTNPYRNTTDHLDYAIADGFLGGTATSKIRITVGDVSGGSQSANLLGLTSGTNGITVTFAGIPTYTYHVQRTTFLNGASTVWVDLGTATVASDGKATFTDTNPPGGQAYYRTAWP
jgi:hypothetical protein